MIIAELYKHSFYKLDWLLDSPLAGLKLRFISSKLRVIYLSAFQLPNFVVVFSYWALLTDALIVIINLFPVVLMRFSKSSRARGLGSSYNS